MGASCCKNTLAPPEYEHNEEAHGKGAAFDMCFDQQTFGLPHAAADMGKKKVEEPPERYVTDEELVEIMHQATERSIGRNSTVKSGKSDSKKVMINVDFIETILMEGEKSLTNMQRCDKRRPTGYVTRQQVESAAQRVSFIEGDDDEEEEEDEVPTKPVRRKATGMVTKEELLKVLSETDDDDDDEGGGRPQKGGGRVIIVDDPTMDPIEIAPAPRRKGRKPTGFVSQSKLRKVLVFFAEKS